MIIRKQNQANDQHPRLSSERNSTVKLEPEPQAAVQATTTNPSVEFRYAHRSRQTVELERTCHLATPYKDVSCRVNQQRLRPRNDSDQPAVNRADVGEAAITMSEANRRAAKPAGHDGSVASFC